MCVQFVLLDWKCRRAKREIVVGSLIVGKGTKDTLPAFTQSTIFKSFSDITKSSYHWCCEYGMVTSSMYLTVT